MIDYVYETNMSVSTNFAYIEDPIQMFCGAYLGMQSAEITCFYKNEKYEYSYENGILTPKILELPPSEEEYIESNLDLYNSFKDHIQKLAGLVKCPFIPTSISNFKPFNNAYGFSGTFVSADSTFDFIYNC